MNKRVLSQFYDVIAKKLITTVEVSSDTSTIPTKTVSVQALWDTGATRSVISHRLMTKLNLSEIETAPVHGVNSSQVVGITAVSVMFANGLFVPDIKVCICDIPPALDMLLGMDVIRRGDFLISNAHDKTLFSFVIPSLPEHISLADEIKK